MSAKAMPAPSGNARPGVPGQTIASDPPGADPLDALDAGSRMALLAFDAKYQMTARCWMRGWSQEKIGKEVGLSGSAAAGRVHRMRQAGVCLPAREPAFYNGARRGAGEVERVRARTTRAPNAVAQVTSRPASLPPELSPRSGAGLPPVDASVPPDVAADPTPWMKRSVECCWPISEPGTRAFRFCDDLSLPGKPYCAEHAKLAYVPRRQRELEDA